MNVGGQIEVSVVMPCLNEADTLGRCIEKARRALDSSKITGEILIADNGSTDDSIRIARDLGARVVEIQARGYGSALMGGIAAARGRLIVMGDADDSYDFGEVPRFVEKLRHGYDLVQGCRLPAGGGRVLPGAMPFWHRWFGNPLFSRLARLWFGAPVHDVYCGMRGFTREHAVRLEQRCTGMEFATEMIIKSSLLEGARIAEVPISLHPDGRRSHPPHLKTVRDGWRTLRFFMMCSPRWLFFLPGVALVLVGLLGYCLAMPGATLFGATLDAHTLLFASLAILCGHQSMLFALMTKTFAVSQGLAPEDRWTRRFSKAVSLERGLVLAAISLLLGLLLLLLAVERWREAGFGHLDYAHTMRLVIPGATLASFGFQTFLASFFVGILGLARK